MRRPLTPITSLPPMPAPVSEPTPLPYLNPNNPNNAPRTQRPPGSQRASSVSQDDREGSDDGVSTTTREGEESLIGSKMTETIGELGGPSVAIQGHPCAAGCGHYCWATNSEPVYGTGNVLVGMV